MDGPHEGSIFISTKWMDPKRDQDSHPQSGRTPRGIKIHIHKVDRPHEGSRFMSTKWTDPTRVNFLTKSTKWTDPTRDLYSAHKVDGPHKGLTVWQSPQSGRTTRGIKIHIHKVDGPYEGSRFMSTKWTDPTRDQYSVHKVDEPHEG